MCAMTEYMQNTTMTSIFQKSKIFLLGMLILSTLTPSGVFADEGLSFSVSPTIYDMTANPGQTWQSTVRIINPNPFELTLSVTPNNFVPKEEDGIPQFISISEEDVVPDSLAEWINIEKEIKIGAEQTYELPFQMKVPEGATPGGHYAALMISTKPVESQSNSEVQTAQVISALVFLSVTGDITEQAAIRSFRSVDYFLSKPETRFEIRVENKGNVHMQPQGEIKIFNMWGKERGVIPINQQTMLGNVLPESVRKFSFEWESEWSITDMGRYTAEVTLAYGKENRQFLSSDTAFWIIPWKILLSLLIVVGGLLATITWAIKLYIRRVLALAGVEPLTKSTNSSVSLTKNQTSKKTQKTVTQAKRITAPIEVSILDLRSKLRKTEGPYLQTIFIYLKFIRVYWKFFVGVAAIVLFVSIVAWFASGALDEDRAYEVTDSATGEVVASSAGVDNLENGFGAQVILVNRTDNLELLTQVSDKITSAGFVVSTTTTERGAPEEKTVIVYNPEVSKQAVLLSRILNNALLSSFTTSATSTEKLVVYVGNDAAAP
jgi:hypothetical protein